jgi:hypothetical protein
MTASPQNQDYYCSCDVKGYNTKSKREVTYPNIWSAILPVPCRPETPILSQPENFDLFSPISDSEISGSEKSDSDFQAETTANEPYFFSRRPSCILQQPELVHRLGLSDTILLHGGCSLMPLTEV